MLESITDGFGNSIPIYEQSDISEFLYNFIERLQEGLAENKNLARKLMRDDIALLEKDYMEKKIKKKNEQMNVVGHKPIPEVEKEFETTYNSSIPLIKIKSNDPNVGDDAFDTDQNEEDDEQKVSNIYLEERLSANHSGVQMEFDD